MFFSLEINRVYGKTDLNASARSPPHPRASDALQRQMLRSSLSLLLSWAFFWGETHDVERRDMIVNDTVNQAILTVLQIVSEPTVGGVFYYPLNNWVSFIIKLGFDTYTCCATYP